MAITIQKSPSTRNWSGNPIHYRLHSTVAAGEATAYFEIKIKFKRADAAVYSDIVTLPYYPVAGTAKIDIQNVLDGLMEYELPGLDPESMLFAKKMTGHFYIAYREITIATPDPAFTDVEPATPLLVIKGGISFEKWRGDNYWVKYWDIAKPFLTWQLNGAVKPHYGLVSLTQRIYLAWLNLTDVTVPNIKIRRTVMYTDGIVTTTDIDCPSAKHDVVFFNCGATELGLPAVFPDKTILYWEMQVRDIAEDEPISELFRFNVDNNYDKTDKTFNYRNSLGGLDSVRIRGVIEDTGERKFTTQDSIVQHDYFTGNAISPKLKQADSTELLLSKADIGLVNKEEQDRLREIHFRRECWWAQQKKWLPINISTGTQKIRSTADDLWSLPIEFSIAHTGDNYYTPSSIDLEEGEFVSPLLCTSTISDPLVVPFGDGWLMNWDVVTGAPAHFTIQTPGLNGGAPFNAATSVWTFDWLPFGDNLITVTPICLIGGEYYPGVAKTLTITNGSVCTPVNFADTPALPDAVKDVAYTYEFQLTGTAPFELVTVMKPSWMTIEIVGDLVQFSGTPTVESAGASVIIVIRNCSGGSSVLLNETIAVAA